MPSRTIDDQCHSLKLWFWTDLYTAELLIRILMSGPICMPFLPPVAEKSQKKNSKFSKISLLWNSKKLCLYVLATNKRRQTFFSHYVLIPPTALLWDASRPTMAFLPWINQSKRKENKTTCSIQQQKSGRTIERTTISTSERRPVPIKSNPRRWRWRWRLR